MSLRATLQQTAEDFFEAITSLNVSTVAEKLTEDCVYSVLPASLGATPMSREEFQTAQLTTSFFALLNVIEFTTHSIVIDTEAKKVSIHASAKGELKSGSYANEFSFFLEMTEDGKKLKSVKEFVDVELTRKVFALIAAGTAA